MTEEPIVQEFTGPSLGAMLRGWRERALLTQEQLAERAGLSVRTIRRLEGDHPHRPRGTSLSLLAAALSLNAAEQRRLITTARAGIAPAGDAAAPRQLPRATAPFVGRRTELSALDAARATAEVLAVVGCAGIGKTALAVHWAHRVADRFPDGHLYVNLHGFDPNPQPLHPAEAIRNFLHALGVPRQRVPADTNAAAAMMRSAMAGRRLLIVIDNARDAAHVRPLLPGGTGCLVIVTSRNQLPGLIAAGAAPVVLDPLPDADARQLLTGRLGSVRADAEPQAVAEIAALCGGLPLALCIMAARAATHRGFSLGALAAELRATGGRLDALSGHDSFADLRGVFSWSYRILSAAAARMFRLLSLHPDHDIGVPAAAGLAGLPARQAHRLLTELHHAHLLAEPTPGRYRQHGLLRAYAAELTEIHDACP
ncbi:NB-ARC domain-containing protein [Nonomuraea sp. NPDC050547]|uniref:NB-ARC domain-containing protein n=1 Tax=Nonomuraea sp. NPDC050547 TaxID=3364368 RepID=UPI0037B0F06C